MTLTMHQAAIPAITRVLGNLSGILGKAAAHCVQRKIEPNALLGCRLYPDMFPLTRQVQLSTDFAKGMGARLAGIEVPKFPDTETGLEELQARIAKTTKFLQELQPAQFAGAEAREIVLQFGERKAHFNGREYLFNFALPNFYFHVTTAYDILRHCGLEIGKSDYVGSIDLR